MLPRRLPQLALRASRTQTQITRATRPITSSAFRYAAAAPKSHDLHGSDGGHDAHESHFDPPGGWLWGQRPGEKYEREGWEIPFYAICAMYVVAVIAYSMKEDTS